MDYNNEFSKLLDKAKEDGYEFFNDEFHKIKKNEDTVKVLSVRAATVGSGEENGFLEIYDKLFPVSECIYNELKTMNEKTDKSQAIDTFCDVMGKYNDEDWFTCDCIGNIIDGYNEMYVSTDNKINSSCYNCDLIVNLRYLDEDYMEMQLLDIPVDIFNNHKQIYVKSNPLNPDC